MILDKEVMSLDTAVQIRVIGKVQGGIPITGAVATIIVMTRIETGEHKGRVAYMDRAYLTSLPGQRGH
jgi:hypothetical protein